MAVQAETRFWQRNGQSTQKGYFLKLERARRDAGDQGAAAQRARPRLLFLLIGVLVALLAFVAVTFYLITRDGRNQQQWIGHSTNVQVLSQQVAKSANEAAGGTLIAFVELAETRSRIGDAMTSLREGDPAHGLPPVPATVREPLNALDATWQRVDRNAQTLIEREALIMDLSKASTAFFEVLPQIGQLSADAVRALTQGGAPGDQIFAASRQVILSERALRHLTDILRGGPGTAVSADNFRSDVESFEAMLTALLRGSASAGVSQVRNADALRALGKVRELIANARPHIELMLASSADLLEVRGAADGILSDSRTMFDEAQQVSETVQRRSVSRLWPSLWSGSLALIVMLGIIGWLMRSFLIAERQRALEAGRQNQRNQQAIMRLLDEMESLADGDLTVRATVTEDMTGAIADSVNFAVEQLRELVNGINITAQTVAESAQETMSTTSKLAEASGRQAEHVRAVTETINEMAQKLDIMAERSRESSEVAERSVAIANNGTQMVQQTIRGMDTIRDQIQKTSKRIKRLGESSQEIGDIVELINGIAEQTNILALNAAIQSASAGGAGRGFAVVADEVQRLAERASNATRRIEMLVKNIQTDTAEAVISMESTTSEVVRGAQKAEDAGEALERIESVSIDLSRLIAENSKEAQEQSRIATQVAGEMQEIRDISIQTSEGTNQTARSMGTLANLVRQLRESVADFKLPVRDEA